MIKQSHQIQNQIEGYIEWQPQTNDSTILGFSVDEELGSLLEVFTDFANRKAKWWWAIDGDNRMLYIVKSRTENGALDKFLAVCEVEEDNDE